jgi:hypothetical protein
MVNISEAQFENSHCIKVSNDRLTLWLSTDFGPRVLGLSLDGGENILVVLPDAKIPVDGAGDYTLRGGHRLWYAPEDPKTTYITDDDPVIVQENKNGIEVIQNVDQLTGIQKSMRIVLDKSDAMVKIDHKLSNQGSGEFKLAPWAITMLKPGGTGLIPLQTDFDDPHGLQPNRQLVLWPYTEVDSPYLVFKDRSITVIAKMEERALKVGAPNPMNWLAYKMGGTLFVKQAEYNKGMEYLDRGASSQIYCNPDLIELETLGPVVNLRPSDTVEHQEIWQIYGEGEWPEEIKALFEDT